MPPIVANASNSVAVWPGHALAAFSYRRELHGFSRRIIGLIFISLSGGIIGAILVAYVGNKAFGTLIPFLLLFAVILFALGPNLTIWMNARLPSAMVSRHGFILRFVEFLIAVYGGFFGAGLGIMLMASLQLTGVQDIQANNALKNLIGTFINSVAVVVFIFSGLVSWPHTVIVFIGAVIGGLAGAKISRRLPATWFRGLIIVAGLGLSIYYFIQW